MGYGGGHDSMGEGSNHIGFSCESFMTVYINNTLMKKKEKEKPTDNIMLNGERQKATLLTSGAGQECLLSPLLLNIYWKF